MPATNFGGVENSNSVTATYVGESDTPIFTYDKSLILKRCEECLKMPNKYGLTVRYDMTTNSDRSLLNIITDAGLQISASSLSEVSEANLSGVPYAKILLTTQEEYCGKDMLTLQSLLLQGLKYNVCSMKQLYDIGDFACKNYIDPGIRIYPCTCSCDTAPVDSSGKCQCFGVLLSDLDEALKYAWGKWIRFKHVHVHVGFVAEPEMLQQRIDFWLSVIAKQLKESESLCFGGILNTLGTHTQGVTYIEDLGNYIKKQFMAFYKKHGRKLKVEIDPGDFIVSGLH